MIAVKRLLIFLVLFAVLISSFFYFGTFSTKEDTTDFSIKKYSERESSPDFNINKNAYFGDLHVHTKYSFDAFIFGTTASPDDAYRYAKGSSIKHPLGFDMQLEQPLDFYAVTDHATFLGMLPALADTSTTVSKRDLAKKIHNLNSSENLTVESSAERSSLFRTFIFSDMFQLSSNPFNILFAYLQDNKLMAVQGFDKETHRSAWADIAHSAERHNDPGNFTTFIAYEYTASSFGQGNLHRNVIFESSKAPIQPFSFGDSSNPEDLWTWMDNLREEGIESLAIPHNSNGSNGQMFKLVDWAGSPLTEEASDQRIRNEPLVEITQVKGTSDTHPLLSPADEWADFEIADLRVASPFYSKPEGSYVRDALLRGLMLETEYKFNPYEFGLIGSSDTHTGAISDDESNYHSKVGIIDGNSILRGSSPMKEQEKNLIQPPDGIISNGTLEVDGKNYIATNFTQWGASGLAAVWAEENTRKAIYSAFRRKETFATTGSRIKVRFFAGYDLKDSLLSDQDALTTAYKNGIPMGSQLIENNGKTPAFFVWAIRDSKRSPLDRLQVIKGWVDSSGKPSEKVFDVACSNGASVDPVTHRCPHNGAKVNLQDCSIPKGVGSNELKTLWKDPEFNPDTKSFYYVRVLENPSCRWSTWDAIKSGNKPRSDIQSTIQERAWSSPIWYIPPQAVELRNIIPTEM